MISFALTFYRFLKAVLRSLKEPEFAGIATLCIMLLLTGTVFYSQVEGWRWIDALYFSAMTLATVGYGDFVPTSDFAKLFTVLYTIVGIGAFVALFSTLARNLLRIEKVEDNDEAEG